MTEQLKPGAENPDALQEEALVDDYLDDLLDAAQRVAFEDRLETSMELRSAVAERRRLLAALSALPERVDPPVDGWVRLERAALEAEGSGHSAGSKSLPRPAVFPSAMAPVRSRNALRWGAVAAALIVTLGLGFSLGRLGTPEEAQLAGRLAAEARPQADGAPERGGMTQTAASRSVRSVHALSDAESALNEVKRELRATLDAELEGLPPETAASLMENLVTIERAIAEVQLAIAANPNSTELRRALVRYRENEIDLLQRVTRAASRL